MHKNFFLLGVFLIVQAIIPPVYAETLKSSHSCMNAKNTADILACAKDQNDLAQERLSGVFEKIISNHTEESLLLFRQAQTNWLLYRNEECEWEESKAENEALKRIEKLSCLARLTNIRAKLLDPMAQNVDSKPEKMIEVIPRWMNVLLEEYPTAFWKYGTFIDLDMNGDGIDEKVITGLEIKESLYLAGSSRALVAIIENPVTGRPKINLLSWPVTPKLKNHSPAPTDNVLVCTPHLSLSPQDFSAIEEEEEALSSDIALPEQEITGETITAAQGSTIRVDHGKCPALTLYWDGEEYTFQSEIALGSDLYSKN